jgi:hypothetical protein
VASKDNAAIARRSLWRMAVTAMVFLTSIAAVFVIAEPAHARCDRIDVPIVMTLERLDDDKQVASEHPNSGTCDGLGDYRGRLCDDLVDGEGARLKVYKHQRGPLINEWYIGGGGQCTPVSFNESDRNAFFELSSGGLSVPRNSSGF